MKTTHPHELRSPAPDHVFYVECSVPAGMTLNEYRRRRPRRATRWERLKRLAGGATVVAVRPA